MTMIRRTRVDNSRCKQLWRKASSVLTGSRNMGVLFVPPTKHERKRVLLERIYEIVYREAGGPFDGHIA